MKYAKDYIEQSAQIAESEVVTVVNMDVADGGDAQEILSRLVVLLKSKTTMSYFTKDHSSAQMALDEIKEVLEMDIINCSESYNLAYNLVLSAVEKML